MLCQWLLKERTNSILFFMFFYTINAVQAVLQDDTVSIRMLNSTKYFLQVLL